MDRRKLEAHLRSHGCELHHHGGKHDVWWNPETEATASIPRHKTVKKPTARAICRDLGVPLPPNL
jgi:mRNA interferase HicA